MLHGPGLQHYTGRIDNYSKYKLIMAQDHHLQYKRNIQN